MMETRYTNQRTAAPPRRRQRDLEVVSRTTVRLCLKFRTIALGGRRNEDIRQSRRAQRPSVPGFVLKQSLTLLAIAITVVTGPLYGQPLPPGPTDTVGPTRLPNLAWERYRGPGRKSYTPDRTARLENGSAGLYDLIHPAHGDPTAPVYDPTQSGDGVPTGGNYYAGSHYDPTAPSPDPLGPSVRLANVPTSGPSIVLDENRPTAWAAGPPPYAPNAWGPSLPPPRESIVVTPKISEYKSGFLQKLAFTSTWLHRDGLEDLGITELESLLTVALPLPNRDNPLFIASGFNARLLDGPIAPELPARLYDAYMEFRWLHKRQWGGWEIGVSPGVYSDFEKWNDDAFRIKGRAGVLYGWHPNLKLVMGVLYLDRKDISVLPVGGVIYTPNSDVRYELIFPRSKTAWRFHCGDLYEDWVYLGAEFAGDEWVYQRTTLVSETVTMRDIRVRIGVERKRDGGGGARLEIGYVFSRELEFSSGIPEYHPDGTVMIRGGWAY